MRTVIVLGQKWLTQQWLLSVEVIGHALNLRVESCNLSQHDSQVLKYQATRSVWVLRRKLCKIVANAASNVYNERSIIFGLGALDQPLSNREEVCVHPAGPTLAIATHMVVELRSVRRVRLQVREEVELGVVCVLVRAVFRIARFRVVGLRGEEIELRESSDCATGSVKLSDISSQVTK
jgi:hypothetical protein